MLSFIAKCRYLSVLVGTCWLEILLIMGLLFIQMLTVATVVKRHVIVFRVLRQQYQPTKKRLCMGSG